MSAFKSRQRRPEAHLHVIWTVGVALQSVWVLSTYVTNQHMCYWFLTDMCLRLILENTLHEPQNKSSRTPSVDLFVSFDDPATFCLTRRVRNVDI